MYSEYSFIRCNWFGGNFSGLCGYFSPGCTNCTMNDRSIVVVVFIMQFVLSTSSRNGLRIFLHCVQIPLFVITNFLLRPIGRSTLEHFATVFALHQHNFLTFGRLSVTKGHMKVLIGTLLMAELQNCRLHV